jgi:protein-tyrosine phosphatase
MTSIEIDGLLNARSFGDPSPWLVRSGSLDSLAPSGRARLAELGVTLVLDLREERERRPGAQESATGGPEVRHLPLYGTPSGPPLAGTIEDVYSALVTERGSTLAAAVAAIADSDGVVLVHCAVGKDRTGLVVALALLISGTPREEVLADYALSGPLIDATRRPFIEALLRDCGVEGAAADAALRLHLESPVEAMSHALDLVDGLGGPHAYLLRHGVTPDQLARIRDRASAGRDVDRIEYSA